MPLAPFPLPLPQPLVFLPFPPPCAWPLALAGFPHPLAWSLALAGFPPAFGLVPGAGCGAGVGAFPAPTPDDQWATLLGAHAIPGPMKVSALANFVVQVRPLPSPGPQDPPRS